MSKALDTILAAIEASDAELLTILREQWPCLLGPDEKRLITAAMQVYATGLALVGSEGGNGAADAGKALIFSGSGGIAATDTIVLSLNGGVEAILLSAAGMTGARSFTFADKDGQIPVLQAAGVPAAVSDPGVPGAMAADNDFLYVYIGAPTNEWRRAALNAF